MMKISKMASIAIMIGGALINATAFVVGSYLAEYLSGDQNSAEEDKIIIYKRGPLEWPKVLQVDPGRELMGDITREMAKHDVRIRRRNVNVHRDQGIVKRFNRTLGERLFTFQYSLEMNFKEVKRSTEWAKRLPEVILALNSEATRLTGKKPVDAIKEKVVDAKSSTSSWPEGKETRLFKECKIFLCRW